LLFLKGFLPKKSSGYFFSDQNFFERLEKQRAQIGSKKASPKSGMVEYAPEIATDR
jgi:hypothetical protein